MEVLLRLDEDSLRGHSHWGGLGLERGRAFRRKAGYGYSCETEGDKVLEADG